LKNGEMAEEDVREVSKGKREPNPKELGS